MLHIITGRTGSGKTIETRNLIAEIAKKEPEKAVLIVPEQFSFETERAMLTILGNESVNNATVVSFSKLAKKLLSANGKLPKKSVDDSTRAILMSIAIESLGDKTVSFKKHIKSPALISNLVAFRKELKKYQIAPNSLLDVSKLVRRQSFSLKLSELAEIFNCYDALVHQSFGDDTDYLDMLCELLETSDYFVGKIVAIDGFSGFSGQEYAVIEKILKSAQDVYVTFCYDSNSRNNRYEIFYNSHNEIAKLKALANTAGVKIASTKELVPNESYKAPELTFLEENLFASNSKQFPNDASAITLIPCQNRKYECDAVASEIRRLVRKYNYRYRDIVVIERQEGSYKNELASSFRKYGIKCFFDSRQPLVTQPLVVFLRSLMLILNGGFATNSVLGLLKTGLFGFTTEEIGLVEDYVLMWRIEGNAYKNDWVENPFGLGAENDEKSEKALANLNELRKRIVAPIISLKSSLEKANGEEISKELFLFLRKFGIDENLKEIANVLESRGESELSLEQNTVWKTVAETFDILNFTIGKQTVSLKRYSELFDILVSSKDVGVIPNSVDEVTVGTADRIRISAPKVVFVVGANEGVFPGLSSGGVLLTDKERVELIENNVNLISNLEYNSVSELYIAYRALSLSTEKLYVSYSKFDSSSGSKSLFPSDIVTEIENMFPKCSVQDESIMNRIESEKSAFSALATESVNGSVLASSLYDYFENNGGEERIEMIDKIRKKEFSLQNKEIAKSLFGTNMVLSASRAEKYYKCAFGYFCQYGLNASARKVAEVDAAQSGTLIHYTLETILKQNPKEKFISLSDEDATNITYKIIDEYVVEKMGGYENKSVDFIRTVNLIKNRTSKIVIRLRDEFKICEFKPVDFELNIDVGGQLAPYKIDLENDEYVSIRGKVDRVDSYINEDNNYIRIIDYKTGTQDFSLANVLEGLNMQMLIYLFAIWQNGAERYGNVVPAGVLYYSARSDRLTNTYKDTSEKDIESSNRKKYLQKGLILKNIDVVNAMENGMEGLIVPGKIDKKTNTLTGNVISLNSLYRLKEKVDDEIRNMVYGLYDGKINAYPVKKACDYCDFRTVCRRETETDIKEIPNYSFDDVITMLGSDDSE